MKAVAAPPAERETARFRTRLLIAMMILIATISSVGVFVARRNVAADNERDLEREFQAALTTWQSVQQLRHAALVERCRALARKPRIHAALEDGALDLLYPSASDELRDVLAAPVEGGVEAVSPLRARFYRFLDGAGRMIPPVGEARAGELTADEEARLALPIAPAGLQLGYLATATPEAASEGGLTEVIATPIVSTENKQPIAVLVLGFRAPRADGLALRSEVASGVWMDGRLHMPALAAAEREALGDALTAAVPAEPLEGRLEARLAGRRHRVFFQRLNPDMHYPPAYEVCVFPLTEMEARQRRLSWQIAGAGAALVLGGFLASYALSRGFSGWFGQLARDSEQKRAQLEHTSAELERAARFAADASHQLKTPVTVMRAGLQELAAGGHLGVREAEEVNALVKQTYRLSAIIEDLLLLSRMDAGLLHIRFGPVDLARLIEGSLDDLSALPDELGLTVESDFPPTLRIAGEKRYVALILQNLLENARKYNRPGGRIRIAALADAATVALRVSNTTRQPIPPEVQPRIFERFHRGAVGENIPGYGLGLNLARQLAREHDGDLRLVRSDEAWTEFEVTFRAAVDATAPVTSLGGGR